MELIWSTPFSRVWHELHIWLRFGTSLSAHIFANALKEEVCLDEPILFLPGSLFQAGILPTEINTEVEFPGCSENGNATLLSPTHHWVDKPTMLTLSRRQGILNSVSRTRAIFCYTVARHRSTDNGDKDTGLGPLKRPDTWWATKNRASISKPPVAIGNLGAEHLMAQFKEVTLEDKNAVCLIIPTLTLEHYVSSDKNIAITISDYQ